MGFDVPDPYVTDETFKVFYDSLDDEQKGLFQGIFACAANPGDGAALASLASAVKAHFTSDEAVLQKANYAEYSEHKPLHDDFMETLEGLKAQLSEDQLKFAKEWWHFVHWHFSQGIFSGLHFLRWHFVLHPLQAAEPHQEHRSHVQGQAVSCDVTDCRRRHSR